MEYRLAEATKTDIREITQGIATDNPRAAEKWHSVLFKKFGNLAQFPRMGKKRDDLRPGVYCFPYGEYLIFYDITDDAVIIVHVVHGARNLPDVFHPEDGPKV